ncbi:hypothetical protein HF086_003726 [Spodoptera exigua]|uniref:MULE transposase domain-containing protein n=1 Tax=Spodoptera exigua TaxID=7107 RepID=A0A922M7K9_SPOEX|nr:hypothetical protein HF086_003726 [Spodoptera exigua]
MDENQPSTSKDYHRNISYEIKDQILLRNDYEYLHKRTNKDGSDLWRCRKKNMCNATVKILNQSIVHESNNHTHPPKNISELTIESEMKLCLKNIQQNVTAPVSTIFEESIDRIKDKGLDLVTTIPLFENRKKTLYKKRNLALGAKKIEFKKAVDIDIPKKYENLLFADYKHKNKRILILCNEEMLKYLSESRHFFIDGTFKLCQKIFYQLYTMHADIGSNDSFFNVVPILNILLPDKTRATYEILFSLIKARVPQWNPSKISMDFEVSAILALQSIIPGVKILGCFFHFTRCLWRKAKELGVTKSKLGKVHVKLCSALSHLPQHLTAEGWLYIMEDCPRTKELTAFNDYFVNTWLENNIFSTLWCSYGEEHTTNNIVEAWNNHVKKFLKPKPNIVQFLEGIRKDSIFYWKKLQTSTNISKRSPESRMIKEKITLTVQELLNDKISVGHCLEKLRF